MAEPDRDQAHTAAGMRVDRREARRAFSRAASEYDAAAVLQQEIGRRLEARLDDVAIRPETVLDLGCGTGTGAGLIARRYRRARVIAMDFALPMLAHVRRHRPWFRTVHRICGEAEHLPLPEASVDLIHSNLMLQWCPDLDQVFAEIRRVLKPGGLLIFSSFGPDTLKELRTAWEAADDRSHVSPFMDMHDIGDALVRAGLAEPVLDVEEVILTYADARGLMRDIKRIGAHNATAGRPRGMTGPGRLARMEAAYEAFRDARGRLPATYEVVYGNAWGNPAGPGRRTGSREAGGEVHVPVQSIGRRRRES